MSAILNVLHDSTMTIVDVAHLAADGRRCCVALDIARLALEHTQFIERKAHHHLSHQCTDPLALVVPPQP
ncbi:hypothetical protein K1Y80_44815 [Streptomyces sp. MAG02]|nr:hypothetical protein [Streptomyces sp. MAG02]